MIDMYIFPFWTCFPFDYVVFVYFIFFVDFTFVVWWFSFVLCLSSFIFVFMYLLYVFDLWLPWVSSMFTHSYIYLHWIDTHISSNAFLKIYIFLLPSSLCFDILLYIFMYILLTLNCSYNYFLQTFVFIHLYAWLI